MLKLNNKGFTLIELMITITIVAILLMIAVPAMSEWARRSAVISTAESLLNGLRIAQQAAIRTNVPIDFVLVVADTTPTSTISTTAAAAATNNWTAWIARQSTDNTVVQRDNLSQSSNGATLRSSVAAVNSLRFQGFGQVRTTAGAALADPAVFRIQYTNAPTVPPLTITRCVYVTPGAAIKVCDPSQPAADLRSCSAAVAALC